MPKHTRTFRSKKLNPDHVKLLNECIRKNVKGGDLAVQIKYHKPDGTVSERRIKPIGVKDKSLLLAHCHDKDALRSFRLERISMLKQAFWDGFEKQATTIGKGYQVMFGGHRAPKARSLFNWRKTRLIPQDEGAVYKRFRSQGDTHEVAKRRSKEMREAFEKRVSEHGKDIGSKVDRLHATDWRRAIGSESPTSVRGEVHDFLKQSPKKSRKYLAPEGGTETKGIPHEHAPGTKFVEKMTEEPKFYSPGMSTNKKLLIGGGVVGGAGLGYLGYKHHKSKKDAERTA